MGLTLTLGIHPVVVGGLIVLGIVASVLLILTILIQRPQGGGLAAAFGGAGAGSGQTAFGAKTGDALTIMTIVVFVLWLLISIGLVRVTKAVAATPARQGIQAPADSEPESSAPATSGSIPAAEPMPADATSGTTEEPGLPGFVPHVEPAPSEPETPEGDAPATEPESDGGR